jgi:hypothetical protein
MLDQLINLGKQHLSQSLKDQGKLNDQQIGDTFSVAKGSFLDGLKDQAMSGNISQLTNLFNGKESNSNFLTENVMKHFVPQLASKIGISQNQAMSIGNMVIPFLVSKFASKETGAASDGNGLMGMLGIDTGGLLGGLGSKLGGLFS